MHSDFDAAIRILFNEFSKFHCSLSMEAGGTIAGMQIHFEHIGISRQGNDQYRGQ